MAKSVKGKVPKYAYVLSQEHYYFAPDDDKMVAATPMLVLSATDAHLEYLMVKAHKDASRHAERFKGEVKEFKSTGSDRYRVWVDSLSEHCDKFVWVVRRVEWQE